MRVLAGFESSLLWPKENAPGFDYRLLHAKSGADFFSFFRVLRSLAKYSLSILMTFPSANRASRAAWRARRLALLTLSSSVLVRDLLFSNFNLDRKVSQRTPIAAMARA